MAEDSKGGKLLVRDVPSIEGGEAQMTIPAAEVCAAARCAFDLPPDQDWLPSLQGKQ